MPGTDQEIIAIANSDEPLGGDRLWADGTTISEWEWGIVETARRYLDGIRTRKAKNPAQRTAMRLLRSFLSDRQRAELRRLGYFYAHAASGRSYRIDPRRGITERVTKHGKHYFTALRFCLHDDRSDPAEAMPPADLALAHLLMIHADEHGFIGTANATNSRDQLWNGEYLRNLRRRPA